MQYYKGFYFVVVYSPDDGGYYAEISDSKGRDIGFGEVLPTKWAAANDARGYIEDLINLLAWSRLRYWRRS